MSFIGYNTNTPKTSVVLMNDTIYYQIYNIIDVMVTDNELKFRTSLLDIQDCDRDLMGLTAESISVIVFGIPGNYIYEVNKTSQDMFFEQHGVDTATLTYRILNKTTIDTDLDVDSYLDKLILQKSRDRKLEKLLK